MYNLVEEVRESNPRARVTSPLRYGSDEWDTSWIVSLQL